MNHLLKTSIFCLFVFLFFVKEIQACHPLALTYYTQASYTPGVGFQATADSNPATFGCNFYWLEMEIRCDSSKMDDSSFSGVYGPANCIPFFQGPQITKPVQMAMTYPPVTVPDSVLCPGMTYYYRLRENIDTVVGPWTPVMSFTVPGTLDTSVGSLNLTASPQVFCGSTQLGWNWNPGGGCRTISCDTTTRYQWYVISGEPINVPVNFSCDTCPYPIASPTIPTTYGLTITVGDTNSCGYGIYTMNPVTVTPLPPPIPGTVNYLADCNGNVDLDITGYYGDIQWYTNSSGQWDTISGAISDTLSQNGILAGTCFTVQLSTSCGTIFSDTVCLGTMSSSVPGTLSYTDDCQGNVTMSVSGQQGSLQWQVSSGGYFSNLAGDTLTSLLQSGFVNGNCFRVMSFTACDTTYSDTICPIAQPQPINGVINYDADCDGNVCLWVNGAQGDLQWQSSIAGGSWSNIVGANTDSICQSGINTGDCFRVLISTVCDSVYTDTVCPTMFEGPTAAFTYSPPGNSQSNVPMSFTDMSTGNIVSWEWDFGGGNPGQNNHIPNPTHTYHGAGFYTVTLIVTDANGCTDTVSVTIEIVDPACGGRQCKIIIPNVFTPNGDGDNDLLMFKNLEYYTNKLQVFNRWGKLVYEKENYKNDWDGEDKAEGTYYFILKVNSLEGGKDTYKGTVTLLR